MDGSFHWINQKELEVSKRCSCSCLWTACALVAGWWIHVELQRLRRCVTTQLFWSSQLELMVHIELEICEDVFAGFFSGVLEC